MQTTYNQLAEATLSIAAQYWTEGKWRHSARLLENALTVDADLLLRAGLQVKLAQILAKWAEYERAIMLLKEAHEVVKSESDAQLLSDALYEMGEIDYFQSMLQKKGDYEDALRWHNEAFKLRQEIGDQQGQVHSLSRLGVIYERMSEYDRASEYYAQSVALAYEINFEEGIIRANTHQGGFHFREDDYTKALEYYERSLEISRQHNIRDSIMWGLSNTAMGIFRARNDVETALNRNQQAFDIAEDLNHRMAMCIYHMRFATIYGDTGDEENSRAHWEACLAVAEESELVFFVDMAKKQLEEMGDRDSESV